MQENRLHCSNYTHLDLTLQILQFRIDDNVVVNISLSDLVRSSDEQQKETSFEIEFTENEEEWQMGESFFKNYYVSIDMRNSKMLFSPLNHFPAPNHSINMIRFLIGFAFFFVSASLAAMVWQKLNDPWQKNKMLQTQGPNGLFSHGGY